jgi:hypothetical protein
VKFSFFRHCVGDGVGSPGERDRHKEQQPLQVGKVGTRDKDELMNSREVWVRNQKTRKREVTGTDEGTGCSQGAQEHNERSTLMFDKMFTFQGLST